MAIDLTRRNQRIRSWTDDALEGVEKSGRSMGIEHRPGSPSPSDSLDNLKARLHTQSGEINRIGIQLNRSLVYTHKGAGKGRGGTRGSVWYNKKGEQKKTAESSKGKMATAGRTAKPWFNQYMEGPDGVENLATIVAEETGDAIVNNILVK